MIISSLDRRTTSIHLNNSAALGLDFNSSNVVVIIIIILFCVQQQLKFESRNVFWLLLMMKTCQPVFDCVVILSLLFFLPVSFGMFFVAAVN